MERAGVRPPPGRIARSEKHGWRGRLEITGRIGEALYAVPRTFYCSGAPLPLGGPVMKCLMLAGGAGSRLAARGGLNPLAAVAGLSLVERAIVTAHAPAPTSSASYVVTTAASSLLISRT
jgi:hypothetical protein